MNNTLKTIVTLACATLVIAGCDMKNKDQDKDKATTIEQIQAEKGKPARVVKSVNAKLTDVRKFSGSIEGIQQNKALSKLGDPLAKINVHVGSTVQKDQVLAEYFFTGDNTGLQKAQEQVNLLEKNYERLKEVQAKGGVSQKDVEALESQLKIAKMDLETARRANLILAPAAGVVTEMNWTVGQVPGQNGTFCTIAKLDQVILKLNVTSRDIGLFKKGAAAVVNMNGETVKGKVTLIPLAADPNTRFFPVEVTFQNSKKKLLPGMYVTAELDARQVDGIVVPYEAVVYANGLNTVWTIDAEGKARRKIVEVGVRTKDDIQIIDGLSEGETVMVEGMSKMNDGDKVLVVE